MWYFMRRVDCDRCGVTTERIPWADGKAALLLARDITLERSLRAALIESRQRY